jgi:foldase protein PrsA
MRSVKVLWSAVVVLSALVLVLVVLLVRSGERTPDAPGGTTPGDGDGANPEPPKPVAVIGGRTITEEQLQARLLDKYGAELLNQMLDREAVRLEAEELGMTVSREEIDAELKRMQQGYESEEQFYESMEEQLGLSKSELREDVYYKLLLEHIAIRTVQVPESDVDEYIKSHPEEFKSYVQYHLQKIEVQTKEEANRLLADLRNGADFESLARKQSIDETTAEKGGDLGWVEENDPLVPAYLLEAARTMDIDEVRGPLSLKTSYVLIRLKEKKEVSRGVDEETRAYVRKELALQRAVPMQQLVKSLREKRHAEILVPELR